MLKPACRQAGDLYVLDFQIEAIFEERSQSYVMKKLR